MENTNNSQNQGSENVGSCEECAKKCCKGAWGKWGKGSGAKCGGGASGGCIYGLGLIGAAIYYFQSVSGAGPIALGILKAVVWPAIVVYKLLGSLGA